MGGWCLHRALRGGGPGPSAGRSVAVGALLPGGGPRWSRLGVRGSPGARRCGNGGRLPGCKRLCWLNIGWHGLQRRCSSLAASAPPFRKS